MVRRIAGDAKMSVFKRGRVWWYNFYFQGVRYQRSTGATARDLALQAEAVRKAQLAAAVDPVSQRSHTSRFSDFVNKEFEPWCAVEHKDRPSTYARYMRSIKARSEEHTSELQSRSDLVCRLLLEKKNK